MIFIETPVFTAEVLALMPDEDYRKFQNHLAANPTAGDVIPDTGGLRKIRWSLGNKGKRGGVRFIYYYVAADSHLRMLFVYAKNELENLTQKQKKQLRAIVEGWQS